MTKKNNNPDNLYQRNGIWCIRYNVGGKKIRRSLGTRSLREAKRLRDEILVRRTARARFGLAEPALPEPSRTFAQIVQLWVDARLADESLSPRTRRISRVVPARVLLPTFGDMLMEDISVEHIERFIGDMRRKYARSTVANYFAILRNIIRTSIKRGWFPGPNPLDRLERVPTAGPGRDVTLTEDEARQLLQELSGRVYFKSALALYTGLRWGEVHGLGWADLDLESDAPTLPVRRSYRGKPKNRASAATVPISSQAAALMRRWQARQGNGNPWVFPSRYGGIAKANPQREATAIHEATERAGIDKHITPHVFRHTFGTWIYERTRDPKLVQRLMRHASFQTSMGYVHDRRDLAPIVERLPDLTSKPSLRAV